MNKKALIITILVVLIGGSALFAVQRSLARNGFLDEQTALAASSEQVNDSAAVVEMGQQENQDVPESNASSAPLTAAAEFAESPTGELSDDEIAALLFMREEEKLPHDVYVVFSGLWASSLGGEDVFARISQSELAHMDVVSSLLERYGLEDPASSELGVFTNPDLQALYTRLVAQGSLSLAEALKVGAAIEEIDILDLQNRLAQTENAEIQQVFSNLARASGNHLRSFSAVLNSQTGEIYQSQYLSQEAYAAIVSRGAGGGNGNGQGGRGQGEGQDGYGMKRGNGGSGKGVQP
jgi:hypothetical protein